MDPIGLGDRYWRSLCLVIGVFLLPFFLTDATSVQTKEDAVDFLQNTGYMARGLIDDIDQYTTGLAEFQKFYGLDVTGALDNATLGIMNEARCGLPDMYITTNDIDFSRYKRYAALPVGWKRTQLTYTVLHYSRRMKLSQSDVDLALKIAFKAYEDVTVLTFRRTFDENADILISFYEGYHDDRRPFDGPGGVLAHAFFPYDVDHPGEIHFDDSESWSLNLRGVYFAAVAAHEIGHSLGLLHSDVIGSVMFPIHFNPQDTVVRLHPDDILGIESLYGNGMTTTPSIGTEQQPGANNPGVPNLCHQSMDAIIATDQGELIILKGSYVWRATEKGLKKGYPRLISQRWAGLQNNLQTGTQLKNTFVWSKEAHGKLVFVKGRSLWRYSQDQRLDKTFPQDLNKLLELEAFKFNNLVGMFEMRQNGDMYFFEQSRFYIFNWLGIVQGPFWTQTVFRKAPPDVAAVFQWTDDQIYFFTHSGLIYKYRSEDFVLEGNPTSWFYPRKGEPDWLGCSTNLVAGSSSDNMHRLSSSLIGLMIGIAVGLLNHL